MASVASDVLGISGRVMLEALVQGTTDPAMLAELARGRLRGKLPALRQALAGRFRGHHAFLIEQLLAHLDYLDEAIGILSGQVETVIAPFADALTRLDSIPGINQRTAEVIIAEIGVDMSAFPSAGHLASWAALCPGNHESAGKHTSGKTRKGNRWLRPALIEAAAGATRVKNSALQARFRRVLRHRGPKKAVVAVAHGSLTRGVPCPRGSRGLSRAWCRLLRSAAQPTRHASRDPAPRAPGLPRNARTRRMSADDGLTGFSEQ